MQKCSVCGADFDMAQRLKELGRGKSGRPPTRCRDCYKPNPPRIERDIEGRRLRDNERKKIRRASGPVTPVRNETNQMAADLELATMGNDMQMARNLVGKMVAHLSRNYHLLAPRDIANSARQISQVVEILSGGEVSKNPYSHVELVVNFGDDKS